MASDSINPIGYSVETDEITDLAVTTAKIANGAVTSAKLDSALSLPYILAAGSFSGNTAGSHDVCSISGLAATDIIRIMVDATAYKASSNYKAYITISDGTNSYTIDLAATNNVNQYMDIFITNFIDDTSYFHARGIRDDDNAGATPNSFWVNSDTFNTDWFIGSWTITLYTSGGSSDRNVSWIVERISTV